MFSKVNYYKFYHNINQIRCWQLTFLMFKLKLMFFIAQFHTSFVSISVYVVTML